MMRLPTARCLALYLRSASALGVCAALALSPAPAFAQSAADKATARTLATEGIKLFRANKFAEALDKLQRAQSLYDAPVHLLYIARSQVKLDKLVDGSESYRRLVRFPLEPNPPPAFKEAIESGKQELEELEPKVPTIRIEVEPANLQKLELRMDGEAVPAAVVGIDRPANPGAHTVQAWAPGYDTAEAKIDLKIGEKKPVKLVLKPGTSGPPPVIGGPPPGTQVGPAPAPAPGPMPPGPGPMPPGPDQGQQPPPTEPQKPPSKFGFMAGLRLGGAIPGGVAFANAAGDDVDMSKAFQGGGGGEVHGGLRFLKYFTVVLFYERHVLKPGEIFDVPPDGPGDVEITNTAFVENAGLGAMIGTPRNQLGGYGEIDFLFVHRFQVDQELHATGFLGCNGTRQYEGPALRIGGGMNIPVADFLHLTPFLMASFGKFDKEKISTDCPGVTTPPEDIAEDAQRSHSLLFVGVGGDFLFGADKPID
jgi:hypothetical protein